MSFDIEYRPKDFDEFIGNEVLIQALKAWVDNPKRKRVLLFSGPPGTGKTTLAKILVNKLECSELNFRDLNIANTGGVDDARELVDDFKYPPKGGGVKVYLLDETQDASPKFQNCLLTPLEDKLPPYVIVIFCTTDPQKLKPALRSRCTKFEVKPLTAAQLRVLIHRVLKDQEVTDFPKEAIDKISQVSESPREALVILDKVLDLSDEKDLLEAITEVKAEMGATVSELTRALLEKKDWGDIAKIILKIQENEVESIRRGIGKYCEAILLSPRKSKRAKYIMQNMEDPFYNSGRWGLTWRCLEIVE